MNYRANKKMRENALKLTLLVWFVISILPKKNIDSISVRQLNLFSICCVGGFPNLKKLPSNWRV
jgi:hypothetical protein